MIDSIHLYETNKESGPKLTHTFYNPGWVELLQKTGSVYFCKHPTPQFYNTIKERAFKKINEFAKVNEDDVETLNAIGLVKHLAKKRLSNTFVFPPMAIVVNGQVEVNTGNSKLCAEIICATDPSELSFIVYVSNKELFEIKNFFNEYNQLLSTADYETRLNIKDTDYKLEFTIDTPTQNVQFTKQILTHTVYDNVSIEDSHYLQYGRNTFYQLETFTDENKQIAINVTCNESFSKLVAESNDKYKIKINTQPDNEWHWSFGRILAGATNTDPGTYEVHIWLFNPGEPLTIDIIQVALMWLTYGYSGVYTQNKNLLIFRPGKINELMEVGNFIK